MRGRRGMSFADFLIILGVVLLLCALAIPYFRNSWVRVDAVPVKPAATNVTAVVSNTAPEVVP